MPNIYTVKIDGQQIDIKGDRPPNEQEARTALAAYTQQASPDFSDVESGTSAAPAARLDASAFRRSDEIPSEHPASGAPGGPPADPYAMAVPLSVAYQFGPNGPASLIGIAKEGVKGLAKTAIGSAAGAELGSFGDRLGLTGGYGTAGGAVIGGVLGGFKGDSAAQALEKLPYGRYTAPFRIAGKLLKSGPSAENAVIAEKMVANGVVGSKAEALDVLARSTPENIEMFKGMSGPETAPAIKQPPRPDVVAKIIASEQRPSLLPDQQTLAEARLAARKALGEHRVAASQALTSEPVTVESAGSPVSNEFARASARRRVAEEAANKAKAETSRIAAEGAADVAPNGPIERAEVAVAARNALSPDLLPDEDIRKLSMEWKTNTATRDFIRQELMQRFPDNWRDIVAQLKRGGSKF